MGKEALVRTKKLVSLQQRVFNVCTENEQLQPHS